MNLFFFTQEALVPLRKEASEGSEMVSQLVFGEYGEILEQQKSWSKVRNAEDTYEGWVDHKMVLPIPLDRYKNRPDPLFVLGGGLMLSDGSEFRLPLGARLPLPPGLDTIQLGENIWEKTASLRIQSVQPFSKVLDIARLFLNTPYLWGGRSGSGIDCSGYTQLVFRMCGRTLPRDSRQQALQGKSIPFGEHREGDLAFFRKQDQEKISHVGIIGKGNVIYHASGKVRLDFLTKIGILKHPTGNATHILVDIKRY